MTAALVVLAVFVGISLCISTVAVAILLANGKVTFPHTNMRRLQHVKVETEIAAMRLQQEQLAMQIDAQVDLRLQRVALPPAEGDQHGS